MIDKHIIDFNESLIGLRDFVNLIDPFLNERAEEHDKYVRPLVLSAMIDEILSEKVDWKDGEKEKFLDMQQKIKEEMSTKFSEDTEVVLEKEETESEEIKSLIIKVKSNDYAISEHIQNSKKANKHIQLLYTNSLISLLSNVELFFSEILHYFYDRHPDSAGVQKRTLTLSDLKSFGSIEDAEKYLIDV
ncbi:MAG: hypothetical protein VXW38_00100, partial [Bacteroidota bacterium]|nr:hypothetical protein [Bacteroidota bacterium]